MKRKLTAVLLAALFALNIFAAAAMANTVPNVTVTPVDSNTTTGTNTVTGNATDNGTNNGSVTTPDSGLTPDSPLYGLKVLTEKVNLLLTADPQEQATLYARYAIERMNEAKLLSNTTDTQKAALLQKLTEQYTADIKKAQDLLKQALASGADVKRLIVKIDEAQNITGISIVLDNVPVGSKNEIKLALLQNVQDLEELKLIEAVVKKGVDQTNIAKDKAMAAINNLQQTTVPTQDQIQTPTSNAVNPNVNMVSGDKIKVVREKSEHNERNKHQDREDKYVDD